MVKSEQKAGASYIEVVIVLAIIAFLLAIGYLVYTSQLAKGRDAKRKDDLEKIKVAFEDYFNDRGCYPPETVLDECGAGSFTPYLNLIPCDPLTREPYQVVVEGGTSCPSWYFVLTRLESELSLSPGNQCYSGCFIGTGEGGEEYNWSITSGNVRIEDIDEITSWDEICATGRCYELDAGGVCNSSLNCTLEEDCFSDPGCSEQCRIDSCP